MNITVLAVGTKMPRWVDDAVNESSPKNAAQVSMQHMVWPPRKNAS